MDPLHREKHEAPRDQQHVIQNDTGLFQIPGILWTLLHTLRIRIMEYEYLRYDHSIVFVLPRI